MPLIAIAEDNRKLRDLLKRGLDEEGFAVRSFGTAAEVLASVTSEVPAAVIIDIGLPDADGRDLCQALRVAGVGVPVVFLTARTAVSDRLSGFNAGGDDYVVKPFVLAELVLRLRALLRRGGDEVIEVGEMRLDPATHAVHVEEKSIALTPTEFRILAALAARPKQVMRRSALIAAAWPAGGIVHDNTLDSYVARIRRKIRDEGFESTIATVRGVGYRIG